MKMMKMMTAMMITIVKYLIAIKLILKTVGFRENGHENIYACCQRFSDKNNFGGLGLGVQLTLTAFCVLGY